MLFYVIQSCGYSLLDTGIFSFSVIPGFWCSMLVSGSLNSQKAVLVKRGEKLEKKEEVFRWQDNGGLKAVVAHLLLECMG